MQRHAEPPCTLTLTLTITDHPGTWHLAPGTWHLSIGEGSTVTTRSGAPADCAGRGTACDVHLALWNRLGTKSLDITGDAAMLHRLREQVQIPWH